MLKHDKIGLNRTGVDDITQEIASKFFELAKGLTYEQFSTAVQLATEDVESYLILQPQ